MIREQSWRGNAERVFTQIVAAQSAKEGLVLTEERKTLVSDERMRTARRHDLENTHFGCVH